MSAPSLSFHEWLCWPTSRLVQRGVPRRDVRQLRYENTGHQAPLHPRWALAFGFWGAVADVEEVAARTSIAPEDVRRYAKDRHLRLATRRTPRRTRAELALMAWRDRARPFSEATRRLGVLPAELLLYRAAGQLLADLAGSPDTVMSWDAAELERRFTDLRLSMEVPAAVLRRVTDHHAEVA
jgi:hypothetical protein